MNERPLEVMRQPRTRRTVRTESVRKEWKEKEQLCVHGIPNRTSMIMLAGEYMHLALEAVGGAADDEDAILGQSHDRVRN